MSRKNKLPIENNEGLLLEYGRAFAWINLIEYVLGELIYFKGNLNLANPKLAKKLLEKKTFGAKIELSRIFLDVSIVRQLETLNKKRVTLAHSAVSEKRNSDNVAKKTGRYIIQYNNKEISLTKNFLKEIVELAQNLSLKLHAEFTKKSING